MKNVRLISGIFALSIMSSGIACADSSTTPTVGARVTNALEQRMKTMGTTTPAERLKTVIDMVQKRNEEIASTTKTLMQKLTDRKTDARRLNILKGYTDAYGVLMNLADRVETRTAKMDSDGIDVSASKILLTAAEADLAIVKTDMQSFTDELGTTTSTSTRKAILSDLKTQNAKLLKDVRTAHSDLVKVIQSLAQAQKNSNSTTTQQ